MRGLATLALVFLSSSLSQAVTIDWVAVGNPGNAPDLRYDLDERPEGYGAVSHTYQIGKYEVTNAQYTEMLNAVATLGDANGLYNTAMGGGWNGIGGIARAGSGTGDDPWAYTVRENRGNRPVNYVSWRDALRFANWLHNGQPSGGQDATTTEDGAYAMLLGSGVVRKPDARVFLPSEDEWYKAAYYDPNLDGGTGGYWDYATQSNATPTSEAPAGTDRVHGSANYSAGTYPDPIYYTTEVGAYDGKPSASAYGTFDQAGNLWEWNEAIFDGAPRGLRGGAFSSCNGHLHASDPVHPSNVVYSGGFRLARIPEPSAATLARIGLLGLLCWRRSRG